MNTKTALLLLVVGCSSLDTPLGSRKESLQVDGGVVDVGVIDAGPVMVYQGSDAATSITTLGEPLYFDDAGSRPSPLRFAVEGEDTWGYLDALLRDALQRWQAALCVPLAIGPKQHVLLYGDSTNMSPGRLGQTTGTWDKARMRVKNLIFSSLKFVVIHEVGHVLARSNDHPPTGVMSAIISIDRITSEDVNYVCGSHPGFCRCQRPEIP